MNSPREATDMLGLTCKVDEAAASGLRPYLLLVMMATTLLMSAVASAATIFQENFADGLGSFTATGKVDTGEFGARLRIGLASAGQLTSVPIDATGFTNITLSFDRITSGLDIAEAGVVSYSTDGVNFTVLESLRTASGRVTLRLGAAANNQSTLYIRFALTANSFLENYTVANIVLEGTAATERQSSLAH